MTNAEKFKVELLTEGVVMRLIVTVAIIGIIILILSIFNVARILGQG